MERLLDVLRQKLQLTEQKRVAVKRMWGVFSLH